MKSGKLVKKILIKGSITAKTGMHIGSSNSSMSIGGADATVVRNPISNEPYIPGSSLKGKMRSLIEKLEGEFGPGLGKDSIAGPLVDKPDHFICQIFGSMPEKMKGNYQPTSRLIVRDCDLKKESREELMNAPATDMPFTEVKTEVVIDRITSAATPRQIERVPAGAVFNMRLILNIFQDDNEQMLLKKVFESLCLVQNDYIGGKGTRGSGEVSIQVQELKYKDRQVYETTNTWKDYTNRDLIPEELQAETVTI